MPIESIMPGRGSNIHPRGGVGNNESLRRLIGKNNDDIFEIRSLLNSLLKKDASVSDPDKDSRYLKNIDLSGNYLPYYDGQNLGNTNLYYDDVNSRVGLNTTSPITKLHVNGAHLASYGLIHVSSSDHAVMSLNSATDKNSGFFLLENDIRKWTIENDGDASDILKISDATPTEVFMIEQGGNVGINTTSPITKLHVNGAHLVSYGLIHVSSSDHAVMSLNSATDKNSGFFLLENDIRKWTIENDGDASDILKISNATPTEVFMIEQGGNVGIGTVSPACKLHLYIGADSGVTNTAEDNLIIESNTNSYINVNTTTTTQGGLLFNDSARARGAVMYHHNGDYMRLYTAGSEQIRIASDGGLFAYNLKSGANQGAAGASANEIFYNTTTGALDLGA